MNLDPFSLKLFHNITK